LEPQFDLMVVLVVKQLTALAGDDPHRGATLTSSR
jgi:hypothetical protein